MKILNLGSLNIDRTYRVNHLVEAKETIKAIKYEEFCGGKGLNQSVALAKAGANVFHAGCVGKDGNVLLDELRKAGVRTDYIRQSHGPSGHAVIQVNMEGQNSIIICGGANDEVSVDYINSVMENFSKGDMLLLQNEISNVDHAIKKGREKGLIIVFNPSPINDVINQYELQKVDYFIVNEVEGKKLAELSAEDPEKILERLKEKFPKAAFILTLGDQGSYYSDCSGTFYQKVFEVDAVDTTGAGDTFTGYFLAGIASGKLPQESMKYASMASAISVSRHGASPSIPAFEEVHKKILKKGGTK